MKKQTNKMKSKRMSKALIYFAAVLTLTLGLGAWGLEFGTCSAQNIGINSTGATPAASALLDIGNGNSLTGGDTRGLLIPRVALTNAGTANHSAGVVPNPNNKLIVFNTNAAVSNGNGTGLYYYDSTNATTGKWVFIASASNGPGASGQVLASQGSGTPPQWSTLSTGGGCAPTQISNQTWSSVNWYTCATNCGAYTGTTAGDGGFTDWHMPNIDEYAYAIGEFAAPTGGWLAQYFWTRVVYPNGNGGWVVFVESDGYWTNFYYTNAYYCRCVR